MAEINLTINEADLPASLINKNDMYFTFSPKVKIILNNIKIFNITKTNYVSELNCSIDGGFLNCIPHESKLDMTLEADLEFISEKENKSEYCEPKINFENPSNKSNKTEERMFLEEISW